MKVKQFKSTATSTVGPKVMPDTLRDKLNGKSLNEALAEGLISDIGDENGNFIFNHARYEDEGDKAVKAAYALIDGYAVRVSDGLQAGADDLDNIIGDLRFQQDVSTIPGAGFGKKWFRLSMPAGIQLGEAVAKIGAETVVE